MASLTENAWDAIVSEFQLISTGNGFRTSPNQVIKSIRRLDEIVDYPEIGVELGNEETVAIDDNWKVFETYVDVDVVGAFTNATDITAPNTNRIAAGEALAHDMRRIAASLYGQFLGRTNLEWNIVGPRKGGKILLQRYMNLGPQGNQGIIVIHFQIHTRFQDEQLQKPIAVQVGDLALEQGGDLLMENSYNTLLEQTV